MQLRPPAPANGRLCTVRLGEREIALPDADADVPRERGGGVMTGLPIRPSLLVISGDATDRQLISRIAARRLDLTEASDGDQAIDILSTRAFDAVVLDLTLPRLRGIDVLAYYHGRYPEFRNVVVTGRRAQLASIESDAVYGLLAKPLDVLPFLVLLRECARRQRASAMRLSA